MDHLALPEPLKEIRPFLQWENFDVKSDGDLELAGQALSEVAGRLRQINDKRLEIVGPIKKGVAVFEELCRNITDPLKKIDAMLRGKIQNFMDARQAELEEKARKEHEAQLLAEKGKLNEAIDTAVAYDSQIAADEANQRLKNVERLESKEVAVSQTVRTTSFTMSQRRPWKWAVIDINHVPREFLIVDEKRLNLCARQYDKNPVTIPGIEFKQVSEVAIRT